MDAKDLTTENINHTNKESNYNSNVVAVNCEKVKSDSETGKTTMSKGEVPTTRPCAVIGPDRVVPPAPPAPANSYLKKAPHEPWLYNEINYHRPTEYSNKLPEYQNPVRDISPRQTFQENMQRYVMPPRYSVKPGEESNLVTDPNIMHLKSVRYSSSDGKYCEVPYNVNQINEPKLSADVCSSNLNSNVMRNQPPNMWPPGSTPARQTSAPDTFQYPVTDYPSCAGPRPMPIMRPPRTHYDEGGTLYSDPYQDGHRFKPYPNIKERYPPPRYDMRAFANPYNSPYPTHKYDLSNVISPQAYAGYPHPPKYIDPIESYQRSNLPPNYNVPYHSQIMHPPYGLAHGNNLQNKFYSYHPNTSVKPTVTNKPHFDPKAYHESLRNKNYPMSDNFYTNEMSSSFPLKGLSSNYSSINMQGLNAYHQHLPGKSYDYIQPSEVSFNVSNPLSRQATQYSPNVVSRFSPDVTNIHNTQRLGIPQDNYVYSNHSAVFNGRGHEFLSGHDYKYNGLLRNSKASPNIRHAESKDKKGLDVRQFLQMWNEGDEDNSDANNSNKDVNVHSSSQNSQEQLVVLGLVNVPKEELSKYEHIQTVSKLPENIKGYNSIELLNQFEEVIESSKLNSFLAKPRDITINTKRIIPPQMSELLPRPVSPLDVEAKISQSIIHKEVGCNFEIRPCTPKMLNAEIAKPIQALLDERTIEKISNNVKNSTDVYDIQKTDKKSDKIQREQSSLSCKMLQSQYDNETKMETIPKSYNMNDFESNSGLCLASLPRLDNDIELNFPEVNQQFINSNRQDASNVNASKDLPILDDQSECRKQKKNDKLATNEKENEFTKLSKYRRKSKFVNEDNLHCFRTDSVIIKNPENVKESIESYKAQAVISKIEKGSFETPNESDVYKEAANHFESFDSICFDNNNAAFEQLSNDLMQKKVDEKSETMNAKGEKNQNMKEYDIINISEEEHNTTKSPSEVNISNENCVQYDDDHIPLIIAVDLKKGILKKDDISNPNSVKSNDNAKIKTMTGKNVHKKDSGKHDYDNDINIFEFQVSDTNDGASNVVFTNDDNNVTCLNLAGNKLSNFNEQHIEIKHDLEKHVETSLKSKDNNYEEMENLIGDDKINSDDSYKKANEYNTLRSLSLIEKNRNTKDLLSNMNGDKNVCIKDIDDENTIDVKGIENINLVIKKNEDNEGISTKTDHVANTFKLLDLNVVNINDDDTSLSNFNKHNIDAEKNFNIKLHNEDCTKHINKHCVFIENRDDESKCSEVTKSSLNNKTDLNIKNIIGDSSFNSFGETIPSKNQVNPQRSKLFKMLFSPWIQKLLFSSVDFGTSMKVDSTNESSCFTEKATKTNVVNMEQDFFFKKDNESKDSYILLENPAKVSLSSMSENQIEIMNVENNVITNKCPSFVKENSAECELFKTASKNHKEINECNFNISVCNTNPSAVSGPIVFEQKANNFIHQSIKYQRSQKKILLNEYFCSRNGFSCMSFPLDTNPRFIKNKHTKTHMQDCEHIFSKDHLSENLNPLIEEDQLLENVNDENIFNSAKASKITQKMSIENRSCDNKFDEKVKLQNEEAFLSASNVNKGDQISHYSNKKETFSELHEIDNSNNYPFNPRAVMNHPVVNEIASTYTFNESNNELFIQIPVTSSMKPKCIEANTLDTSSFDKDTICVLNSCQGQVSSTSFKTDCNVVIDRISDSEIIDSSKIENCSNEQQVSQIENESLITTFCIEKTNSDNKNINDSKIEKLYKGQEVSQIENASFTTAFPDEELNTDEKENTKQMSSQLNKSQENIITKTYGGAESFENECIHLHTLYKNNLKSRPLKRSLSESSFFDFLKNDISETLDHSPAKKMNTKNDQTPDTESVCQNNRRNSIASHFGEEFSVCILIDNECIITEEDEEVLSTEDNVVDFVNEEIEVSSRCDVSEDKREPKASCYELQTMCSAKQSPKAIIFSSNNIMKKDSYNGPWVEDIACVETVVSEEVTEDIVMEALIPSEPYVSEIVAADDYTENLGSDLTLDNDLTGYNCNSNEITENIAIIDDSSNCSTPLCENNYTNKSVLSESFKHDEIICDEKQSTFTKTLELEELKIPSTFVNMFNVSKYTNNETNLEEKTEFNHDKIENIEEVLQEKTQSNQNYIETQDATIHSCETSLDEIILCNELNENHFSKISSSPEVSSTTPEEQKVKKEVSVSSGPDTDKNDRHKQDYLCLYNKDHTNTRRLITKAAKKYIPPLNEPINEVKVKLPLSPKNLLRLQQLKTVKESCNLITKAIEKKCHSLNHIQAPAMKKVKPKFEDVLKSLDKVNIKNYKDKNKKPKHIPKVVIKKHENGSHYASTAPKNSFNPDLSAQKWQPWVFIEKNTFVDKMALKRKVNAVYNHRKKSFVLTEKFKKYRAMNSAQFMISQPKSSDPSKGQLKYTIKLKHSYK